MHEITRQNLERANIFVIVVTARQLLSNADLDLLRILRGLNKDQIVVFINKVDEIGDFASHAPMITDRIRGLLKREFPGSHIPVVTGSALWAEIALGDDIKEKRELARTFDDGVVALSIPEAGTSFWATDSSVENTLLTDLILGRSGVSDLALAVSEILQRGGSANSIKYAAAVLAALARNGAARAQKLAMLAAGGREGQGSMDLGRLAAGEAVLHSIADDIAKAEQRLASMVNGHFLSLTDSLRAKMKACLAASAEEGTRGEPAAFHLTALVVRLRTELEQAFLQSFQDTLARITECARDTEQSLQRHLDKAEEALGMVLDYAPLPALKGSPSLAALGEPVATDVSLLQGQLGGRSGASAQRVQAMRGMIRTGFEAIADKLAKAADDELSRTKAFILDHFRITVAHTLRMMIDEQRALLARLNSAPEGAPLRRRAEAEQIEARTFAKLGESLAAVASLRWRGSSPSEKSA